MGDWTKGGMVCVACASSNLRILETRCHNNSVKRRRECKDCKTRFTTLEEPATRQSGVHGGPLATVSEIHLTVLQTRVVGFVSALNELLAALPKTDTAIAAQGEAGEG